jgi:hypothetical protein
MHKKLNSVDPQERLPDTKATACGALLLEALLSLGFGATICACIFAYCWQSTAQAKGEKNVLHARCAELSALVCSETQATYSCQDPNQVPCRYMK